MEDILNNTTSLTNLRRLNACRLYLGVTFLSPISNIKSSAIITGLLIGDKTNLAKSNLDWPNQNKPNKATWSMWSRMSSTKRLGQRTKNHLQSTQQYKFLYSPSTKEIHIRQITTYEQWFASKTTR